MNEAKRPHNFHVNILFNELGQLFYSCANEKRIIMGYLYIKRHFGSGTQFSGTNQKLERRRPFGTGLVRRCPQGLFSRFFTFLRAIYFSAPLDFSSSPLSAPGSPRMNSNQMPRVSPGAGGGGGEWMVVVSLLN